MNAMLNLVVEPSSGVVLLRAVKRSLEAVVDEFALDVDSTFLGVSVSTTKQMAAVQPTERIVHDEVSVPEEANMTEFYSCRRRNCGDGTVRPDSWLRRGNSDSGARRDLFCPSMD